MLDKSDGVTTVLIGFLSNYYPNTTPYSRQRGTIRFARRDNGEYEEVFFYDENFAENSNVKKSLMKNHKYRTLVFNFTEYPGTWKRSKAWMICLLDEVKYDVLIKLLDPEQARLPDYKIILEDKKQRDSLMRENDCR